MRFGLPVSPSPTFYILKKAKTDETRERVKTWESCEREEIEREREGGRERERSGEGNMSSMRD
jgi:hypothetical protein